MAASLKSPADFAKTVSPERPKLTLITPNSLQTIGRLKSSKTSRTKTQALPTQGNIQRKDDPQPLKQKQGLPADKPDQIASREQDPRTAPPIGQDLRAQGDVFKAHVPQYTPQMYPVFHPPQPPPPQPDPSLVHLQHTTEVISRQAAEIAQLKGAAERVESRHKEEIATLRKELTDVGERGDGETRRLKAELDHQKQCHLRENLEKDRQHEADCRTLREEMDSLRGQSEQREVDLKERLEQTEQALREAKEEMETLEMKHEKDMREKNESLTRASAQLSQMKVYIQESRPSTKTVAEWELERKEMKKTIKDLESTVDSLKATEQLVNIRLMSTQQLMALQESEILKGQSVIQTSDETAVSILTKWREKVYAMLVQQKSQEIMTGEEQRKHNAKLNELQDQLERSQLAMQKLEHTLSDREAELNLEKQMNQARLQELQSTDEIAGRLDQQLSSWEDAGIAIKRMLSSNQEFVQCRMVDIQGALKKLAAAEQRISFATSRVALLKDLFARKESSWRLAISKASGAPSLTQCQDAEVQTDDGSNECLPYNDLQSELDQVRVERDRLAAELKEQAQQMEKRVIDAMQSLEEQMAVLRETNTELERSLHQASKTIDNLKEDLDHRTREIQDLTETNASLRIDAARMEANVESASDEKCIALEEKYQCEMRDMEKRLNEARREHAKAVVSYRQMERQLNREKERAAETLQGRETYLNGEMERLKKKLREAEKDKNLLMTTLKQEGLISKYKSYRKAARDLEDDDETTEEEIPPPRRDPHPRVGEDGRGVALMTDVESKTSNEPESLSAMLKDVQRLAVQVLGDDLGEVT